MSADLEHLRSFKITFQTPLEERARFLWAFEEGFPGRLQKLFHAASTSALKSFAWYFVIFLGGIALPLVIMEVFFPQSRQSISGIVFAIYIVLLLVAAFTIPDYLFAARLRRLEKQYPEIPSDIFQQLWACLEDCDLRFAADGTFTIAPRPLPPAVGPHGSAGGS